MKLVDKQQAKIIFCFINVWSSNSYLVSFWQNKYDAQFKEAERYKIDTVNKKAYCRSSQDTNLGGSEEITVNYDYLLIAMGACANTFHTHGVVEMHAF